MPIGIRFEGNRRDPYRNFNFVVKFGNTEVAACRKMSGLDATVNVVEFRAGNSMHTNVERSPGRVEYQAVTLESGKTNDLAFEEWANMLITNETRTTRPADPGFRRDVTIEVRDVDGTPALKYILYKAWVTKYTAISDLAGDGNDTIIETLEVTHEGFDRLPVQAGGGADEEEAAAE
ncbi:phage tail protein [Mesorhizobium sp. CN2-181]|uniref:phage tail protein n=1 Tax=Mesorhizobium yinganensis TaxID=3157707 RepID=UPI0032B825A5